MPTTATMIMMMMECVGAQAGWFESRRIVCSTRATSSNCLPVVTISSDIAYKQLSKFRCRIFIGRQLPISANCRALPALGAKRSCNIDPLASLDRAPIIWPPRSVYFRPTGERQRQRRRHTHTYTHREANSEMEGKRRVNNEWQHYFHCYQTVSTHSIKFSISQAIFNIHKSSWCQTVGFNSNFHILKFPFLRTIRKRSFSK